MKNKQGIPQFPGQEVELWPQVWSRELVGALAWIGEFYQDPKFGDLKKQGFCCCCYYCLGSFVVVVVVVVCLMFVLVVNLYIPRVHSCGIKSNSLVFSIFQRPESSFQTFNFITIGLFLLSVSWEGALLLCLCIHLSISRKPLFHKPNFAMETFLTQQLGGQLLGMYRIVNSVFLSQKIISHLFPFSNMTRHFKWLMPARYLSFSVSRSKAEDGGG